MSDTTLGAFRNDFFTGQTALSAPVVAANGCTTFTLTVEDSFLHANAPSGPLISNDPGLLRLAPADLCIDAVQAAADRTFFLAFNRSVGNANRSGTGFQNAFLCVR